MFGLTEATLAEMAVRALQYGVEQLENYESKGVKIDQGHLLNLRSLALRAVQVFERYAAKSELEPHERQPILPAAAAADTAGQQQPAEPKPAAAEPTATDLGSAAAVSTDEPGKPAA